MDHFTVSHHQTQLAQDFDAFDLHCASLDKPPDMEDFVGSAVDTLLTEIERWFRTAELDIKNIVNSHPFYVMFEPSLGCDARTDHTTPKSVYPVFMADFVDVMSTLQCKISSIIEPTIRQLIGSREALIFDSITTQMAGTSDRDAEFIELQRELEALKVTAKEMSLQKDEIRDTLTKEITMLREQLFQKKVRIGGLYKPDFAPGFSMEATNVMLPGTGGGLTQADIDHAVKEATDRFNEEKKRLDGRHRAELQSAETQTARLAAEIDSLKLRLDQTEKEADALRTRCEDDVDKQKAYYDDQIEYLNTQVTSLTEAARSASTMFESELAARDRDINKLSAELRDSLEREDYLKGIMNQLKREHKDELDQLQKQHAKDLGTQKAELMDKVKDAEKAFSDMLAKNTDAKLAELLSKLKEQEERNAALERQCQNAKHEMEEAIQALQRQHDEELDNIHSEYNSNSMISDLSGAVEDAEKEFKSILKCVELIFNRLFDDRNGAMTKMLITRDFNPTDYMDSKKHLKMDASHFSAEVSDDSMLRTEPTVRVGVSGVEDLSESLHDLDRSVSEKSGKATIPSNYLYRTVEKAINQQRMGKLANKHLNKALKYLLTWSKTYANSKLMSNFRGDYGISQLSISTDNSIYKDEPVGKKKRYDFTGMLDPQTRINNGPRDDLLDLRSLKPLGAETDLITSQIKEETQDSKLISSTASQRQNSKEGKKGAKSGKGGSKKNLVDEELNLNIDAKVVDDETLLYGNYANMADRDFADQFFTDEQGIPQLAVINSIMLSDAQLVSERVSNSYMNKVSDADDQALGDKNSVTIDAMKQSSGQTRRVLYSDSFHHGENTMLSNNLSSGTLLDPNSKFIDVGVNTVICTVACDNVYFTTDKVPIIMQASHVYECGDCLALRNELSDPRTSHGSGRHTPLSGMYGSTTHGGSDPSGIYGAKSVEWRGIRSSDAQEAHDESDRKGSVVIIRPTNDIDAQNKEISRHLESGDGAQNMISDDGKGRGSIGSTQRNVCEHGHSDFHDGPDRYFVCPRCGFQIPFAELAKQFMVRTGPSNFLFNTTPAAVPTKREVEPLAPGAYLSEKELSKPSLDKIPISGTDDAHAYRGGQTGSTKDVIGFARPPPVDDYDSFPGTKYQPFPHKPFKIPHYPPFKSNARGGAYTNPNMEGVFTRILQRAEELRIRYLRKRELILQERKRTTERILRALSLLTDAPQTKQPVNVTESMGIFAATPPIIRPNTANSSTSVNTSGRVQRMTNSANMTFGHDKTEKSLNKYLFGHITAQESLNSSNIGANYDIIGYNSTDTSRGTSGRGSASKLTSARNTASTKTPFEYKQSSWTQRQGPIDYVAKGKQTIAESNQINEEVLSKLNIPGRRSSISQGPFLSNGSRRHSTYEPNSVVRTQTSKSARQSTTNGDPNQKRIQSAHVYAGNATNDGDNNSDDGRRRVNNITAPDSEFRSYGTTDAAVRRGGTLSAPENYRPRSAYSAFPANALGDRSAHGTRKFSKQAGEVVQRNPTTKMSDVLDVLSTAGLVHKQ